MGAGDTKADTCPCSQAERSYLAEEKVTFQDNFNPFCQSMSGSGAAQARATRSDQKPHQLFLVASQAH